MHPILTIGPPAKESQLKATCESLQRTQVSEIFGSLSMKSEIWTVVCSMLSLHDYLFVLNVAEVEKLSESND